MGVRDVKLFLISFTLLFLELMCIRWLSTEIRVFAYFQNFVLIACFLGFGIGCSLPRLKFPITWTVILLAVFAIFTGYIHLFETGSQILGIFHDYHIVQTQDVSIPTFDVIRHFIVLGLLFLLLVLLFMPVGILLGRFLENHPKPLWAYSVNVAGSLLGIWIYTLVCYFSTPPIVWFAITAVFLLYFAWDERRLVGAAVLSTIIASLFFWHPPVENKKVWWSPYQKLTLNPIYLDVDSNGNVLPTTGQTKNQALYGYNLTANQTHIQFLENMSLYPKFYGTYHRYNLPFYFTERLDDILILGAGCGNDVEAAVRRGVGHIDAVEIDPLIVEIGREYHPNKAYSRHDNVTVIVDDARSFLKTTDKKYDLICFSLLDAHTQASGYTNIRLDDYVYTVEAFEDARRCLKDHGVVSMRFWTERSFTGVRLFKNMKLAFGRDPYVFWLEGMFYVAGDTDTIQRNIINTDNPELRRIFTDQQPARIFLSQDTDAPPSRDDWPYLYLRDYQIPVSYLLIIAVLLVTTLLIIQFVSNGALKMNTHFFFLGAAFLLIEVQNISRIALLFGNTWIVNSVIFSVILIMVLIGNSLVYRFKLKNTTPIYGILAALLVLSYAFPMQSLLKLSPLLRGSIAGSVVCFPLLAASMIFAISFNRTRNLNIAMGSNMTGTVLGGVCACLSFVIGIKALLLIGMVFYAVTFLRRDQIC